MVRTYRLAVVVLFFVSAFTAGGLAVTRPDLVKTPNSVTITLTPSVQSPQFLGTSISWLAKVQNGQQGHIYDYQFAVSFQNQTQVLKDFRTQNYYTWTPYTVEGTYQFTVTVRDITNVPYITYAPVSVPYVISPWVTIAGGSAVHSTSHPLVALFSAGPCQVGHTILVRFKQAGTDGSMTTNSVPCSQSSANWYVAGMYALVPYMMHWEETGPNFFAQGPDVPFTPRALSPNYPATNFTLNVPPTQHDFQYPLVLFHLLPTNVSHWPTATDLWGNIMWYFPSPLQMTRFEPGGNLFGFPDDLTLDEYDLAGNEILQTNVNRINEQLVTKGFRTLDDFNTHETRRLPNGDILLLGSSDLISTDHQGGTQQNPVDIIGDLILVLDHNLQLVWAWDSFLHEDLDRKATQGETCKHGQGGCPRFNQNFSMANDWLHTNAAQFTSDGNIIISQRHQDWVLKVNYQNGHGDGSVIWRMGPFGDFTITNPPKNTCGDPNVFPWFTHQHDSAFESEGGIGQLGQSVFTVFDDGNLRVQQCSGGNSRGMTLLVNEPRRTVTIITQGDLGGYSAALGSADLLPAFDGITSSYGNGALGGQNQMSQSTELNLKGDIVYQIQVDSWSYRIYRRADLYRPTAPE